jgi:type I restriction enzyme R subunit
MPSFLSEDDIEREIIREMTTRWGEAFLFESLNCFTQDPHDLNDKSGRTDKRDVILVDRLRAAAMRLNELPEPVIDDAIGQLTARRASMSIVAANREVTALLRNGAPVEYDDANGRKQRTRVRFLDFDAAEQNTYLAVTQLWIKGIGPTGRFRRPDILLYVNGIPLVFIELKNSNVDLRHAFDDNLTDYKADIPQLFHANAVCILSNAMETRVGSLTATWEYFFNWLRVDDEKEKIDRQKIKADASSLTRVIDGLLHPPRLLDYVESFTLFYKENSKIIAQNHQFIGVNNAYERFENREQTPGKLGVFWHTQGSGKSFSMIFYVRKIFRKATGNFTFVVVTDRKDLDDQIYRNFLNTETVKKEESCQPRDSDQMRTFLGTNKRMVFTLIQKFRWPKGQKYPQLTDRKDVIVMVDEAHRTQYEDLAQNMRAGLANAQFLAFTGTPLLGRDRKTSQWFGDYVSEYNFKQAVDDESTVPLYHQKRVPEVLIQNDGLTEDLIAIFEEEDIDELQREKLEDRFAKEDQVIWRDDRLEKIAEDIVDHFPQRGYLGKAMVITLDKFTAVTMYDKVQHFWKEKLKSLRKEISQLKNQPQSDSSRLSQPEGTARYRVAADGSGVEGAPDQPQSDSSRLSRDGSQREPLASASRLMMSEREKLKQRLEWMKRVEMAVVISLEADDEQKFADRKLDIKPHRQRMESVDKEGHDVEYNFKDPEHPLQLVFVCAMWLTGFDAPTVSTLYLDKPMKDHTLMQTIARANRVTSHRINGVRKTHGEIIDYYNVFRNLQRALKDYGEGSDGSDMPVQEKTVLRDLLQQALVEATRFCEENGMPLDELSREQGRVFKSIELFGDYANTLLGNEERRKSFYVYENTVSSLYDACKPEILGDPIVRRVAVFQYLRGVVDAVVDQQDITEVQRRIIELMDESVVVDGSATQVVREPPEKWKIIQPSRVWDLSKTNFEQLKQDFKTIEYKNIQITDLLAFIKKKLDEMLKQNLTRRDFAERLQSIVDRYNSGGSSNENYYDELVNFASEMKVEDERHVREGLSEDELEIFDLLSKDQMTEAETQEVKLAARKLLKRVLEEHPRVLVEDWFKDAHTRKIVKTALEEVLDAELPDSYDKRLFQLKRDEVFDAILDYALQGVKFAA